MNPAEDKKKLEWCRELVSNQSEASLAFAQQVSLNDENNSKNLVFSPLSLNVVISLVASSVSGKTLKLILTYLKSDSVDDVNRLSSVLLSTVLTDGSPTGGPKLSVANSIWTQKGLIQHPSFLQVVQDIYKADSFQFDFLTQPGEEIIAEVNSWGEKKTNGLVKDVLPPGSVNELTECILVNALYFKGLWSDKFDPSRTEDYDFHLGGGDSVKVPFMGSYETQYISIFDGFKVLRLPYKKGCDGRQFSMCIFLPDSIDGLPALANKVFSETDSLDQHLPRRKVKVNRFRLPKFKFSFGFEATQAVKKLGDPTEMVSEEKFPYKIFHKAFIEVTEGGTEAAAVSVMGTKMGCSRFAAPEPGVDFVADHPFLFLIQEDTTGVVLFFGQVLNPLL